MNKRGFFWLSFMTFILVIGFVAALAGCPGGQTDQPNSTESTDGEDITSGRKDAATPKITKQPESKEYFVDQTEDITSLTVEATSPDEGVLSYQWYGGISSELIDGADEADFAPSIPSGVPGTYDFYVMVYNTKDDATITGNKTMSTKSETAVITVKERVGPESPVISLQPQSITGKAGTSIAALTVEASVTDGGTLSYEWYQTSGGDEDETNKVGTNSNSYQPPNDSEGVTYYYVKITNKNENATSVVKEVSIKSQVVSVGLISGGAEYPNINPQPASAEYIWNASFTSADVAALTVNATVGDGGLLTYQWYKNTADSNDDTSATATSISGATSSTYKPDDITTPGQYFYFVKVTNTNSNAPQEPKTRAINSGVATIKVTKAAQAAAPSITTQPAGATYSWNASTNIAALSVTVATPGDGGILSYQWYSNTAASNTGGTAISSATNATYTPVINSGGNYYYYVEVTNTNAYAETTTHTIPSIAVTIVVNQAAAAATPVITAQPAGKVYELGSSGSVSALTVTATISDSGTGGQLSYQWYSNTAASNSGGTPISSATNATYTPPVNLSAESTAYYYVVVTNTNSWAATTIVTTTSNVATIKVIKIPPNIIPTFDYETFKLQIATWRTELQPILNAMTIDEKAGQMTQGEYDYVAPRINSSGGTVNGSDVSTYFLGSVLSGGHTGPRGTNGSPAEWVAYTNLLRTDSMKTRLRIPVIYGQDDMHGASKIKDATMLPHNVGLGALALGQFMASGGTVTLASNSTGMAEINSVNNITSVATLSGGSWNEARNLVYKDGLITGSEMRAAGILYSFSPVVGVAYDPRWGRTYECFSENTDLVKAVGPALIRGVFDGGAAPSSKHFGPEGQTANGANGGNANISLAEYRPIAQPYKAVIEAGVMCIMASYGSRNNTKIHKDKELLTDLLKTELGFQGMIITDWDSITGLPTGTYNQKLAECINAGVDMVMAASSVANWKDTITGLKTMAGKEIPMERIDDAVMRILLFKKAIPGGALPANTSPHDTTLPKFWNAYGHNGTTNLTSVTDAQVSPALTAGTLRTAENMEIAADLVSKSLVLLKNTRKTGETSTVIENLKNAKTVCLFGTGADDVGLACGGWTVTWQGGTGATTAGVTLRGALNTKLGSTNVTYRASNSTTTTGSFDAVIAVISEKPYAEGSGDVGNANVVERSDDTNVLTRATTVANNNGAPLILIIYSGRPLHLTTRVNSAKPEAVVAAWLPGSEAGTGIADVLFGDKDFEGKTAYTWKTAQTGGTVLYPFGHGLKKAEVN